MFRRSLSMCAQNISGFTKNSTIKWRLQYVTTYKVTISNRQYSNGTSDSDEAPLTLVTDIASVRRITLNDPKRRNTLSLKMLLRLQENLSVPVESDIRVVVIRGAGPVFSSGHNLKELTSREGREYHETVFQECTKLNLAVRSLHVPVIAQVTGLAAAAGCQLVASCDLVVASRNATFSTPGINFGLFCSTPGVSVCRSLPGKVALRMLLTGVPITAQEASEQGLVSELAETEAGAEEAVARLCAHIARHSKSVVALGKRCYYGQSGAGTDLRAAYTCAEETMIHNLALSDGQEGIRAFIEKRPPNWSHTDDTVH